MGNEAKKKKKGALPYDPEKAKEWKDLIVEEISAGKSLLSILRKLKRVGAPNRSTVYRWLNPNEDDHFDVNFADNYARARENTADHNAEEIEHIKNQVLKGKVDPAAARVAIDALKWTAAKKKPRVYGDKVDITSGNQPIEQQVRIYIPDNGRNEPDPDE